MDRHEYEEAHLSDSQTACGTMQHIAAASLQAKCAKVIANQPVVIVALACYGLALPCVLPDGARTMALGSSRRMGTFRNLVVTMNYA